MTFALLNVHHDAIEPFLSHSDPMGTVVFPPHRVVHLLPSDGLIPSVTRGAIEAWEADRG